MTTSEPSLPDPLKSSEDVRKDQHRWRLRQLLLEGEVSSPTPPADPAYFEDLRARVRRRAAG
jgi:hypothetical protein